MVVSNDSVEELRVESSEPHGSDCERTLIEIASLILGITALLSFAIFLICTWVSPRNMVIPFYAGLIAGICSLFGLIIGFAGPFGMKVEKRVPFFGRTTVAGSLSAGVLLLLIFIFMPWLHIARQEHASKAWGGLVYIERLAKATIEYATSHNGYFPDANDWSDSLIQFKRGLSRADFKHPSLKGARYTFAFNKDVAGHRLVDLPKDVVLLFEAEGPWNLHGGQELLLPREDLDVYVCLVSGECYRFNFEASGIEVWDETSSKMKIKSLRWKP